MRHWRRSRRPPEWLPAGGRRRTARRTPTGADRTRPDWMPWRFRWFRARSATTPAAASAARNCAARMGSSANNVARNAVACDASERVESIWSRSAGMSGPVSLSRSRYRRSRLASWVCAGINDDSRTELASLQPGDLDERRAARRDHEHRGRDRQRRQLAADRGEPLPEPVGGPHRSSCIVAV